MIRTSLSLTITSWMLATFGPQAGTTQSNRLLANAGLSPQSLAQASGKQWYPRDTATKTIAAVLRDHQEYSTFLGLVKRAGLLPLLDGTMRDTTSALVTFKDVTTDSDQVHVQVVGTVKFNGASVDPATGQKLVDQLVNSYMKDERRAAAAQIGQLTVFAPTNAAFAQLPPASLAQLTRDSAALVTFVRAHIVTQGIDIDGMQDIVHVRSAAGSILPFEQDPATDTYKVGGIAIVPAELVATNGVVHGLAGVLPWPTTAATSVPTPATP